jgi:hypothetical protein
MYLCKVLHLTNDLSIKNTEIVHFDRIDRDSVATALPSIHCKKRLSVFSSPGGMPLTKLSLAGNNLIVPGQGEFGKWHPGWGRENHYSFFTV